MVNDYSVIPVNEAGDTTPSDDADLVNPTELSVAIWSMDENVSASGNVSFSSQLVCNISIHR